MKRLPLLIGLALVLGAGAGLTLNQSGLDRETVLGLAKIGERVGKIFLSLLSMVVVPLVFSCVVVAITSVSERASAAGLGPSGRSAGTSAAARSIQSAQSS